MLEVYRLIGKQIVNIYRLTQQQYIKYWCIYYGGYMFRSLLTIFRPTYKKHNVQSVHIYVL